MTIAEYLHITRLPAHCPHTSLSLSPQLLVLACLAAAAPRVYLRREERWLGVPSLHNANMDYATEHGPCAGQLCRSYPANVLTGRGYGAGRVNSLGAGHGIGVRAGHGNSLGTGHGVWLGERGRFGLG